MTKACKIFLHFFAVFAMTRPDYFIISQLDLNFELLNPVIKFWYKTQINYVLLALLLPCLAIWATRFWCQITGRGFSQIF